MDNMEKFRQDETLRLMTWAVNNPDMWRDMFNRSAIEIDVDNVLSFVEELEKQDFYYLIPVLWTMGSNHIAIDKALTTLLLSKVLETWKNKDLLEVNNEIKEMVKKIQKDRQKSGKEEEN